MMRPALALIAIIGALTMSEPSSLAQSELDATMEPPVIITAPGPEFRDEARPGAMIIGMDRTPKGRLWGCWTGAGDKPDTYFILATSDDDGATWSKPRLVVGALDPSGKRQRSALVGNLWADPLGRLWLFFDQAVVGVPGPRADWFIRCDNPDADAPVWSKPVCFANEGCTLNKPTVLSNGDWLLPVSKWAEKTAWVYVSTDQGKSWNPRG
ncbi:MAG: exo-alpha-sialidase, partial [Planctomycetes bacterium]|nr:exo-alpha-sialidase [Planctomycetota bacterium]